MAVALSLVLGPSANSLGLETTRTSTANGSPMPAKAATARRLVDVPSPELDIQMEQLAGSYFRVTITPGLEQPPRTKCALVAPKARATFNGVRLIRMRGLYRGGDLAYNRDCLLEFGFPPQPAEIVRGTRAERAPGTSLPPAAITDAPARIRIEDDSAVWTWEVPEAFVARRLSIVSPPARTIAPGQPVVLEWSPAGDKVPTNIAVDIVAGGGATRRGVAATVAGSRISFTVPRDLPPSIAGPATIVIRPASAILPATANCPVAKCSVTLVYSVPSVDTRFAH